MNTLDLHVLKYLKENSKGNPNKAFNLLVYIISKESSDTYVTRLIKVTKTKDMIGLANYIVNPDTLVTDRLN